MSALIIGLTTTGLFITFCLAYWFTYKLADKYQWNRWSWVFGFGFILISAGITLGLSFLDQDVMVVSSAFVWGFSFGYLGGLIWYKLRYRELKKGGNLQWKN